MTFVRLVALLLAATAMDYITGSQMTTVFYVFPTAYAGWRAGWPTTLATAAAAVALNAMAVHYHHLHPLMAAPSGGVDTVLRMTVLLVVGGLSVTLRKQRESLAEQHSALARLNAQTEAGLHATREIQELMLSVPPRHPAVDIDALAAPARILGGDALDLTLREDGILAITVADASGKGTPAAFAGAVLLGLLEDAPERFRSPALTLDYLNERLTGRLPAEMFITMFYGLLDLGSGLLTYASAGHEDPLLVASAGNAEELRASGLPLGLLPKAGYQEAQRKIIPGDLFLCYTDGLTDQRQRDGSRLGGKRFSDWLEANAKQTPSEILRELTGELIGPLDRITDDVTVVAIRYLGAPPLHAPL